VKLSNINESLSLENENKYDKGYLTPQSIISYLFSTYPVRLIQQCPWLPFVSIVTLGFGGGLLQGDCCSLSVIIHEMACAVYSKLFLLHSYIHSKFFFYFCSFRTQGSTKVFKSPSSKISRQSFKYSVKPHGFLINIPDPTVCFEDSKFKQTISIDLDPTSSLIFLDWFTSGRLVTICSPLISVLKSNKGL
jgi:urease accessory protein UreH